MVSVVVTVTALHYAGAVIKFKSRDVDTCRSNRDYVVSRVTEDLHSMQDVHVSYRCEVSK